MNRPPNSPVRRPPSPPSKAPSRRSSNAAARPISPESAPAEPDTKSYIHPPRTASRHTRQPATQIDDDSDVEQGGQELRERNELSPSLHADLAGDSTPARMDQWKRHVEGLIDGDGLERDLAMELGVPAHSMTLRDHIPTMSHRGSLPESPTAELRKQSSGEDLTLRATPTERRSSRDKTAIPMLSTGSSSLTDGTLFVSPLEQNSKSSVLIPPDRPSRHLRYPRQDSQVDEVGDIFDAPVPTSPEPPENAEMLTQSPPPSRRPSKVTDPGEAAQMSASAPGLVTSETPISSTASTPEKLSPDASLDLEAEKIAKSAYRGEEDVVTKDRLAEYLGSLYVPKVIGLESC